MKRYSKVLSLLLTAVMLVSMLAGCGGTSSSTPAPAQDGGNSTAAPADDAPKTNADRANVNIRFSQFGNSTDDPAGMANDPIKKAIEEIVNITLEYDTGLEGYDDRMQTELAVGAAPELFPTWGEADKIRSWVEEEAVHNLGEIINGDPERYPTLYKIINTPEYKAYNKMYLGDENATYAIYSISSLAYPMFNGVPAYNTAILNEVNDGKVPATLDEFVDFTTKAAAAGYSGWWPYNVKLTNWGEMDATIASPMGTSILAPAGTAWTGFMPDDDSKIGTADEHWTLMTTSEQSKEAVKVLAEMYKTGALHQGIGVLTDTDDGQSQFAAGSLAAFSYGYGYYTQYHKIYKSVFKAANPDATIEDVTLGTALSQNGRWSHKYDTGTWVGANYFVPTSCSYPDRVLDLVEFLATSEGQKLLFRGLEGLTYTMDGDTVVYDMDAFVNINKSYGYPNPDRCRYMWFSYLFAGGEMMLDLENKDWWEAVTTPYDNTIEWATEEDKEIYAYSLSTIQSFVDNVYVKLPAYYGFVALPGELTDIRTACSEVTNRYLSAMVGGQMDIDAEWDNYVKEYENAGAAQIEEALNASIKEARETYGA